MIALRLQFPLGVYHALGVEHRRDASPRPEWPPSSVRLVGALLAAAHEVPSDDIAADRAVLERLCAASPPTLRAPIALPFDEVHLRSETDRNLPAVAELRGASRWAPRNPALSELKELSPRVIGRKRTEVDKGGVAVGDLPVLIIWPGVDLDDDEHGRLRRMASNVAWLGTSRSPVIVTLHADVGVERTEWTPLPWTADLADAQLRVPTADLLRRFDTAHETRRSTSGGLVSSGHLRPAHGGRLAPYALGDRPPEGTFDPEHWGAMVVVALADDNTLRPRTPATYLAARAFRTALMDTFDERGQAGDAPPVLHGHGGVPHLAVVPLPFVGHEHADGVIRGFMLVFPHRARLENVSEQQRAIETALVRFLPGSDPQREIVVPDAGRLRLRQVDRRTDNLLALSTPRYSRSARVWETVTPVVHSRWQKRGRAIEQQVIEDCAHVGLPEPSRIELLRGSAVTGGAGRLLPAHQVPPDWRRSLQGPTSHLRLEFEREIRGPILLGRARHFGVGLCVPGHSTTVR